MILRGENGDLTGIFQRKSDGNRNTNIQLHRIDYCIV